jgi:hypothetical protein
VARAFAAQSSREFTTESRILLIEEVLAKLIGEMNNLIKPGLHVFENLL